MNVAALASAIMGQQTHGRRRRRGEAAKAVDIARRYHADPKFALDDAWLVFRERAEPYFDYDPRACIEPLVHAKLHAAKAGHIVDEFRPRYRTNAAFLKDALDAVHRLPVKERARRPWWVTTIPVHWGGA